MNAAACVESNADGRALRAGPIEEVVRRLRPLLVDAYGTWERSGGTAHGAEAWLHLLAEAVRLEARTLDEALALAAFCFVERVTVFSPEAQQALQGEPVARILRRFADTVSAPALATPDLANAYLAELRHHFRDGEGLRGREVMFPLRAALTGSMVGPCLGNVTSLLGVERCVVRTRDVLR